MLCESQQNSGYSINGTFADYVVVDAAFACPVPDGVTCREAAPLTCAGVTTRNDLADVFALHAAGRTKVVIFDRTLDEVNEAMSDVLSGKIAARVVFKL